MENQAKKSFVLDSKSLKIKEVLNQDFLAIEIYAISEGETRNPCGFTLSSMEKSIPTFYNKFILGYFNVTGNSNQEGEFEEHNSDMKYDAELDEFYWSYTDPSSEKALGLIRESDSVEIVEYKGKKWIKLTAVLLTKYNREAVKHLLKSKSKRKISVEITVVKSHMEDGLEWIDEFILDGITILGNRRNSMIPCEEGIEGASLKVLEFLKSDVFSRQQKALSFAYQELDNGKFNSLGENEQKDEIIMVENQEENTLDTNNEEKEGITLTYEQKRELLEKALSDKLCGDKEDCCYIWVADIDDTHVYYYFEECYHKAPFTIVETEEQELEVNVDLENQEQVVRSWETFSAEETSEIEEVTATNVAETAEFVLGEEPTEGEVNTEETELTENEVKEVETFSNETEAVETEVFEAKEESEENEDETKAEEKEEEKTEDDCKKCSEECQEGNEEEKKSEDSEESEEEGEDDEHKEDNCNQMSQEETEEDMCNVSENVETKEDVITFECDGTNMTGEELVEKVLFLLKEVEKFSAECESLNKVIKDAENAKIFSEGKAYIFNEEELDAEEDAEILNDLQVTFEAMCNDSKFASVEEATNYLDVELAKATYKKRKQGKKEEKAPTKEFSAPLTVEKVAVAEEKTDSFDEMKKLLNI